MTIVPPYEDVPLLPEEGSLMTEPLPIMRILPSPLEIPPLRIVPPEI